MQRVVKPAPALTPAVAVPAPTLFRRIVDSLRGAEPQSETTTTTAAPRAALTRVVAPSIPERPRVDLQQTPPEEPVSETPAIRGTNPERLARMLGTEVQYDETGTPSVEMPYVPFSTAPRTVSRAETEAPSVPPPASTTPSQPAQGPTPEAAAADVAAITENVIDTLRRELLIEREQAGGPMDLI